VNVKPGVQSMNATKLPETNDLFQLSQLSAAAKLE
jgi:hypothetical protein